jgi:hypothetical protein
LFLSDVSYGCFAGITPPFEAVFGPGEKIRSRRNGIDNGVLARTDTGIGETRPWTSRLEAGRSFAGS